MCISRANFKLQILPSCSVRFYRRTRENLFKYFRECILSDHILNFHNLHESLLGLWRVNPICLRFTDSQPLAKYIASLDPRYSSLFMDNVWKEAFEHSDTTVGESVAYFLCLLIMKSGYLVTGPRFLQRGSKIHEWQKFCSKWPCTICTVVYFQEGVR